MRLHIAILVLITVIAQTTTEDSRSSSVEQIEEGRLSTSLGSDQSSDPEIYRGDYETEHETNKRLRNRGGKRRRRLRQRVRTTERPPDIDNSEELHTAASSLEGAENEELVSPTPRRRPNGKRRRRPLRRYYENEQPIGRPRRRKGGRKRIRPQVVNIDDIETTTFISLDYDSPTTIKVTSGEIIKTESSTEMFDKHKENEDYAKIINEEVINHRTKDTQGNSTIQNKRKATEVPKFDGNENREFNNELIEPLNKEENTVPHQRYVENEFGHKILERQNLFSNSRRLPETSAILRRRIIPRTKNSTYVNHVRMIKPLANLESELESKQLMKNDSITQRKTLKTNREPQKVNELFNKIKSRTSKEPNVEEPNYPKLELFIRKNRTVFHEDIKVSTAPTEDYPTTTEITPEETTQYLEMEIKNSTENLPTNNNNNSILKLPNLDDELFELLNSEAGRNRLQRILELRNMTLSQLLDHRERGASKFHLSDIFSKPQANSNEKILTTKEELDITKNENKELQKQIENLSSDDILSPPPIFENSDYNSVPKSDQTENINNYHSKKELSVASNQYRESRIFDSMPEFTTKPPIPEVRTYPTWRIIPNPKLKPVSVRGDYKEIKISNIFPSDKPEIENEIDKIFLLEERDNFIEHRKKEAVTSRSADNRETTPFLFRKIPVSVKSAIAVSAAILVLAIFGFLSVLISCRLRQKKARLRAKQDILCEHLQNDDFMTSQQSLSPVLTKHTNRGAPVYNQGVHPNVATNRNYYLWKTLRKTFQYD